MSTLLMVVACAIFLIAAADYNKGVLTGTSTPVFAPWALFGVVIIVNCATNLGLNSKWIDIALFATDFVVCTGIGIAVLIRLKWRVEVDRKDKLIMLASLATVGLWITFHSAVTGVLLNQFAYSLAWAPIYRNVLKDPKSEPTRAWTVFTSAFVLNIVALGIQSTTIPMDYVTPIVCLIHHAAIAGLSTRKKSTP